MSNNPFESIDARLSNIENILHDLKDQKHPAESLSAQKTPVSIKRICEVTNLAAQTIYGLVSDRKIPHFKQGKRLYFFEDEIIAWIKEGKRKTSSEIQRDTLTNLKKGGHRS